LSIFIVTGVGCLEILITFAFFHIHFHAIAPGKTTILSLFLDSLFPKTEIPCMRDVSSGDAVILKKK
jgi:hypothetical protein